MCLKVSCVLKSSDKIPPWPLQTAIIVYLYLVPEDGEANAGYDGSSHSIRVKAFKIKIVSLKIFLGAVSNLMHQF